MSHQIFLCLQFKPEKNTLCFIHIVMKTIFVCFWIMELMTHKLCVSLFHDLSKQSSSNHPKACRMKSNKLIYFPSTDLEAPIMCKCKILIHKHACRKTFYLVAHTYMVIPSQGHSMDKNSKYKVWGISKFRSY